MTLAVTVLGCSAMYSTPERACSGYLLEADGKRFWIDAGGGTWRNLQRIIEQPELDAIFLSHRHPDHTIDLFQCFHYRRYGASESMKTIPLYAPGETLDRLLGYSSELEESFDIHRVAAGDSIKIENTAFSFFAMAHPTETVGIRAENDGDVVAYTADTGPGADFASLAGGADLFICEATFQEADDEWEGHMTAAQAGRAAADAGVGRLVLTHLPDRHDLSISVVEAQQACNGIQVTLATDFLRFEL